MYDALTVASAIALGLLLIQLPATAVLLSRLLKGPSRHPPIEPKAATPDLLGSVSIVVPTLNEAHRISPCLAGLSRQSYAVREIIIVDSNSQDGTPDLVKAAAQKDPRFRLMTDDPLPPGWVGRPWALHNGFLHISIPDKDSYLTAASSTDVAMLCLSNEHRYSGDRSEWILGIDADIQPHPGLVSSLVKTAQAGGYDVVSLSPQFILKYPGECWLQPALLMTLLYRFESAGVNTQVPERVMANGQCFLCRHSVLEELGGYTSAKSSFCDDVTLARNIAARGFKVGFLDGAKVLKVRMYEGAWETWNEWGRSLDLKDAASKAQTWGDLWLLLSVQALPLPIVLGYLFFSPMLIDVPGNVSTMLLELNLFLLAIRFALLLAIAPSYDRTNATSGWLFWLSPLADPLAVLRIFLSTFRTPTQWRGRSYHSQQG